MQTEKKSNRDRISIAIRKNPDFDPIWIPTRKIALLNLRLDMPNRVRNPKKISERDPDVGLHCEKIDNPIVTINIQSYNQVVITTLRNYS